MKEKRVTIPISASIDEIRGFIAEQTGVDMTYSQVINHLIHFYVKHANEPLRGLSITAMVGLPAPWALVGT